MKSVLSMTILRTKELNKCYISPHPLCSNCYR